jgi:hypothetical protein
VSGLGPAVSLVGVAVAGVGLLGLISPVRLQGLVARWRVLTRLPVTVSLRIGFAILFLAGAPQCRLPNLVRLVGILEVAGALTLLALGSARLQRLVEWWLQRPPSFVRSWGCGALAFGSLLAYAGAS